MQSKVVVLPGGPSGSGAVAAEVLADAGARIVLIARDRSRGEAMLTRLRARSPGPAHSVHYADLSSMREPERVGREIAAAEPRIDVLVNNAGAMFSAKKRTAEGLERTFATNHISYFLLTHHLRDRLLAAAPARIVNTASGAHRRAQLDWSDLQSMQRYSALQAYSRSKLYNILYTRELARRLAGTGVTANCFHPGFVATRFGDESGGVQSLAFRFLKLFAIAPARGAKTLVYLAMAPGLQTTTAGYFYQGRPATPSRQALDEGAAKRLWAESARLAGIEGS